MESIPDLHEAVAKGANAADLLSPRFTSRGRQFRQWLAQAIAGGTPEDVKRQYVELIKAEHSMPSRFLRFCVSLGLGKAAAAAEAISETAAAIGEACRIGGEFAEKVFELPERFGKPYQPHVFITDVKRSFPAEPTRLLPLRDDIPRVVENGYGSQLLIQHIRPSDD